MSSLGPVADLVDRYGDEAQCPRCGPHPCRFGRAHCDARRRTEAERARATREHFASLDETQTAQYLATRHLFDGEAAGGDMSAPQAAEYWEACHAMRNGANGAPRHYGN